MQLVSVLLLLARFMLKRSPSPTLAIVQPKNLLSTMCRSGCPGSNAPSQRTAFEWQLPGGWINQGELPQDAVRREVEEETGLRLGEIQLIGVTNNVFSPQNHSISLCF